VCVLVCSGIDPFHRGVNLQGNHTNTQLTMSGTAVSETYFKHCPSRLEEVNDKRQSMIQRLKISEKEKDALEGKKTEAEMFLAKQVRVRACVCVLCLFVYLCRVGQNRLYTPYMTVYMVISLPKTPYIHRIYMVLANPIYVLLCARVCVCGVLCGHPEVHLAIDFIVVPLMFNRPPILRLWAHHKQSRVLCVHSP